MHDESEADGEPPFRDMDDFLSTMAHRLGQQDGAWRACADRRCRRARRCHDCNSSCPHRAKEAQSTEEERAVAMFELRAALEARLRENGS